MHQQPDLSSPLKECYGVCHRWMASQRTQYGSLCRHILFHEKKKKQSACASSLWLTTKYQADSKEASIQLNIKPYTDETKKNLTCCPGIGRGRLAPPPGVPPFFFESLDDQQHRAWIPTTWNNGNKITAKKMGNFKPRISFLTEQTSSLLAFPLNVQ